VQIGWIHVVDFRNYRTLEYSPTPRLNLLIGPNAQGKTNLLEALGMLIAGRSFRTSRLAEMPRWGVEGSTISGELVRGDGSAGRRVVHRTLTKREDDRWQNAGESVEWARVIAFGSSRNTTLSYCRVKLLETVRSSRQAKTSVRSSPADNGRCRFLGLCGSLPKRAL